MCVCVCDIYVRINYVIILTYTYIDIGNVFVRTMGRSDTEEHHETSAHDTRYLIDRIYPASTPH